MDLAVSSPWGKGQRSTEVSHSRHCILFEHLRHYAYSIVNRERSAARSATFTAAARSLRAQPQQLPEAGLHGQPGPVLTQGHGEVRRPLDVGSLTGSGRVPPGLMQLEKDLPLIERQRLAAAVPTTCATRPPSPRCAPRAACSNRRAKPSTQAAIGRVAGLTRQTVATYKHVLDEVLKPVAVAILGGASGKAEDV